MDEHFASMPVTNATCLCVGGITQEEADAAMDEGLCIDGFGYYLFLASEASPSSPIEILAKFSSTGAAERFARLISYRASSHPLVPPDLDQSRPQWDRGPGRRGGISPPW